MVPPTVRRLRRSPERSLGLRPWRWPWAPSCRCWISTIANVSLPTICGNLGVSTENGTWVITAFAVANGVMVPLTGWLMMRFGVVRVFCVSVVAFTMASVLCGLAWNLPALVAFRIMQGGVSGPLIPGSQALLIAIFPPHKRMTALTIWSMTTLSAPVLGPVLGGYISDNYYWGWIFYINIPFGAVAAFTSWQNLKNRETPTRKLPIDVVGLALLGFWVFSLQTMLDLGKDRDWFNNGLIVALGICAVVGFAAWTIWEMTEGRPAVDLTLFKNRNFAVGCVSLALGYGIMFANNLLVPLWLQTQMGYTATWAGLVAAPAGLIAVLVSPLVGRFRVDPRIIGTIAFVAFALSYWMRSSYTPDSSLWVFSLPAFVQGIAFATFFVPLTAITLDGVPPEKVPSATGLSNFARITAGSFSASLVTTYWDRRETLHQSRLVESMTDTAPAYQAALEQLQNLRLSKLQAAGALMRQIEIQAYMLSSLDMFYFSTWAAIAAIAIVWMGRRPHPPQAGALPPAAD